KVIATNAITFSDDQANSPWSVTFYLENAKLRLRKANTFAWEHLKNPRNTDNLIKVSGYTSVRGHNVVSLQFEWEAAHSALRILFKSLNPTLALPIRHPK